MQLRLNSKEDVQLAVRRRGREIAAKMTDKEFFLSKEFSEYAYKLADFLLKDHKLYKLHISYEPNSPEGGCTDGKDIFWNTAVSFIARPKLLERRFKANMGLLFHEVAHKLYLDFKCYHKLIKKLESGTLPGIFEIGESEDMKEALAELNAAITEPRFIPALSKIFANVSNIVDDGHDEAAIKRDYPGFIADCVDTLDECQFDGSVSLETMLAENWDDFSIYTALMLYHAKWGTYKAGNVPDDEPHLQAMLAAESIIEDAVQADDYKERWNYVNLLVLFLWPSVRHLFQNNQQNTGAGGSGSPSASGNGGGGQGGGSGSQGGTDPSKMSSEELQQLLQELFDKAREATNGNAAPVNCNHAPLSGSQGVTGSNDASSPPAGDHGQILQSIAQAKAAGEVQKEMDKAQLDAIRNTNVPLIHQNIPIQVHRHMRSDEEAYRNIAVKTAPLARNLVRAMQALLRELNREYVQRHRYFGPMIDSRSIYRPDKAYFAKKKLPADLPDMALCVLIDQSGSMGGEKLQCARETAILLEQFASGIGIPLMIAGHDVDDDVDLYIYTDYLSAMEQRDRYSLASIRAGGCNRDGLPIHHCCTMLAKRPERVKLMVVISDGAPNDSGYRGKEAFDDIRKIVNSFRRKGMLIYGAAIDDDREVIEDIYGHGFLSIEDLTALPRTLVRLVKQQIT